jgi:hypothetical protein
VEPACSSRDIQIFFYRYVYKFVCDPDALFQMALAENHRAALKLETSATFAANGTASRTSSSSEALAASGRSRHQVLSSSLLTAVHNTCYSHPYHQSYIFHHKI